MNKTLEVMRWLPSEPAESPSEPAAPPRDRADFLRHNYLSRRPKSFSRPTIPTGQKVRAGLGYAPTQKLMPNLGRPWAQLGQP